MLPANASQLQQQQQQQQPPPSASQAQAEVGPASGRDFALLLGQISSGELLLVALLISLIVVSIVGNCLVCVAIFTDRRLRKLGNAFIVSLAIADLFVSCLVMTFALCNDLMNYWIFGDWFCDVWISFDIMCCTASILNLCAISLDRFIHIKDCLLYNQLMTRRVALSAVIIIWFISALVSFVPINLGWHKPEHRFIGESIGKAQPLATTGQLRDVRLAQEEELASDLWPPPPPLAISSQGQEDQRRRLVALGPKLDYFRRPATATSDAIENQSSQWQRHRGPQNATINLEAKWTGRRRRADVETRNRTNSERLEDGARPEDFVTPAEGADSLLSRPAGSSSGQQAVDGARGGYNITAHGLEMPAAAAAYPEAQFNQVESNPQDGSQIGKLNPAPNNSDDGGDQDGDATGELHLPAVRRQAARAGRNNAARAATVLPAPMQTAPYNAQQLDYQAGASDYRPVAPAPGPTGASHPQCMLTLTPTYAIISSTISFYIPCIIMLGLYTKLFACARRHVRNIQAISKAPAPIAITRPATVIQATEDAAVVAAAAVDPNQPANNMATTPFANSTCSQGPSATTAPPLRTWLKLAPKPKPNAPNAQTLNDKSIKAHKHMPKLKKKNNNNENNNTSSSSSGLKQQRQQQQQSKTNTASSLVVGGPGPLLSHTKEEEEEQDPNQLQAITQATATHLPPPDSKLNATNTTGDMGHEQCSADQLPASDASEQHCQQRRRRRPHEQPDDEISEETCTSSTTYRGPENCIMTAPEANEQPSPTPPPPQPPQAPPLACQRDQLKQLASDNQHNMESSREERRPFLDQQGCPGLQRLAAASHGSSIQSAAARQKGFGAKQPTSKVNFQAPTQQQQSGQLATHKAAVTLGIIMGTFLFCWVPFFCLNIIKAFCVDCIPSSVFRAFTWLGYANSALNPIIYGIHNSEFRCAFNRIFFKHLNIKNSRYYQNRRFSYDQRHPVHHRQQQPNCHGRSGNHQPQQQHQHLKSDAIT